MSVLVQKNPGSDQAHVPFHLEMRVDTLTAVKPGVVHIPIHLEAGQDDCFNAEVCGFRVEAASPQALAEPVGRLLRGLINFARLPTYVFVARRSHQIFPVYTLGDEVLATTPGGPVFRHVELAKVRDFLTDYLHSVGELGVPGKSDTLHVRGVSQRTLALQRPEFYLKKRAAAEGDNEFWAPVFVSGDGHGIYTYAASGRREVDLSGGYEVLLLCAQVAQALQAVDRLPHPLDLRADRLHPRIWFQVQSTLESLPAALVAAGLRLEVFGRGRGLVAVEHRLEEDRYSLYLGEDLEDLRQRTGLDLVRRGLLSDQSELTAEVPEEAAWSGVRFSSI